VNNIADFSDLQILQAIYNRSHARSQSYAFFDKVAGDLDVYMPLLRNACALLQTHGLLTMSARFPQLTSRGKELVTR
jgi:Mn-dependent DtxR family transcriptional regulator